MTFTTYGLSSALALLLTLSVVGLWCPQRKIPYLAFIRFAAMGVPLAFLGSRLLFCLSNLPYYLSTISDPMRMFMVLDGGASLTGAFLGLIVAGILAERIDGLPKGSLLDGLGLATPVGILVERLSEGLTCEMGLGRAILSDWLQGIGVEDMTGTLVHPIYRYEAVIAVIILALLLFMRNKGKNLQHGDLLLLFMTFYGGPQCILESMRDDGHMIVIHFVRVNQVAAILLVFIPLCIWIIRARKRGLSQKQEVLLWAAAFVGIALGILQEFMVDKSENLFVDYGIMALAIALIVSAALRARAFQKGKRRNARGRKQ